MIEINIEPDDVIMVNGATWSGASFIRALRDWVKQ